MNRADTIGASGSTFSFHFSHPLFIDETEEPMQARILLGAMHSAAVARAPLLA
jgi:hypothetical protein